MRVFGICVAAILLINTAAAGQEGRDGGFSIKSGLGYDFISQEYFLDSLLVDTLDVILKTNYLDDIKGIVEFEYLPYRDRRLELRATYEQTQEDIRTRVYNRWRTKLGKLPFSLRSELDYRQTYSGTEESGDDYLFGRFSGRLRVPVGEWTSFWGRLQGDFVQFDIVSPYTYNHYRAGGSIGFTKTFESFSALDADVFVLTRTVQDSSALNYLNVGIEGSFFGLYDAGNIDIYQRLEYKDYNLPDDENDYTRFELDVRNKVTLSGRWFSRQEFNVESAFFSPNDPLNLNFARFRLTLLAGIEEGGFSIGAGPSLELLTEQNSDISTGEDYFEGGLEISLDHIAPGSFFGSLESVIGHRSLENENPFSTSFTFERLNLIGDWNIVGGLDLNVLLSAEWEWHQEKSENNRIVLVSSGLTYTF